MPESKVPEYLKHETFLPSASADKLEKLRDAVRQKRDLEIDVANREAAISDLKALLSDISHRQLPDLFDEVGVDNIGLAAEGDLPAYDAKLQPFYQANISAKWEPERQQAAFDYLVEQGHGDLIKTIVTVELGRGEHERLAAVKKVLDGVGVQYSVKLGVPWNTLTAFLREQVEEHGVMPNLELLGATVGKVVKLKQRKD